MDAMVEIEQASEAGQNLAHVVERFSVWRAVSVRRRPLDGVSAHHQDARPSGMRPPVATESC